MDIKKALFLCAIVVQTYAYPTGPPVDGANNSELCGTMFPSGHGVQAQTSDPPFEIVVNTPNCYKTDQEILVTVSIKSGKDTYYEGLFMQARRSGVTDDSFGKFTPTNTRFFKPYSCFSFNRDNNTVGHKDKKHFLCETFKWKPAVDTNFDVVFIATIVHETEEFWMNVKSPDIMFSSNCTTTTADTCSQYVGGAERGMPGAITIGLFSTLAAVLLWH